MKQTIRRGVFETNSSSTHAMTICTKENYTKWLKDNNVFMDGNGEIKTFDELVEIAMTHERFKQSCLEDKEEMLEFISCWLGDYENVDMFNRHLEYNDSFSQEYTTPGGETIVAFGYSGYDS